MMTPMEPVRTPRTAAKKRRRRPHPAQKSRRTAAAVSLGSFAVLTGGFALTTHVAGAAATKTTTNTVSTPASGNTPAGSPFANAGLGLNSSPSDATSSNSWSAATGSTNSQSTQPPVTQSSGS